MVELLVVVSIVAILSISSIVGFGYLGDILKAREATGVLSDLIKQEELKVLRGDLEKAIIHFLPDYVVIEEEAEGVSMDLTLKSTCGDGGYEISWDESGNLTQKDGDGVVMQIKSVEADSECIEFKDSDEIEWNYQLIDGNRFSNVVRFVHFNIKREDLSNPISIVEGDGSRVEIAAPYGKKRIYDDTDLVDSVKLTVEDENKNSQDLTIQ